MKRVTGVDMIAIERDRQIKTGFDADHSRWDFLCAALSFIYASDEDPEMLAIAEGNWPWDKSSFNPTHTVGDLVTAGALIAAAIDHRLQAAEDVLAKEVL